MRLSASVLSRVSNQNPVSVQYSLDAFDFRMRSCSSSCTSSDQNKDRPRNKAGVRHKQLRLEVLVVVVEVVVVVARLLLLPLHLHLLLILPSSGVASFSKPALRVRQSHFERQGRLLPSAFSMYELRCLAVPVPVPVPVPASSESVPASVSVSSPAQQASSVEPWMLTGPCLECSAAETGERRFILPIDPAHRLVHTISSSRFSA